MTKERLLKLSLVLLTIIAILLVWDGCKKNAELSAFKKEMSKLDLSNQKFTQKVNKLNQTIVEQEQIVLSQKDAIHNNLLIIDGLKRVKSQVRVKSVIKVDSVYVPFVITDTDTHYVDVPCDFISKRFSLIDKYYSIHGNTLENGLMIDSLSFSNDFTITIADKKMGFLRKAKPIVSVVYDNPYISTQKMNNIIIKDDRKWYSKGGTWFGIGLGIGFIGAILVM